MIIESVDRKRRLTHKMQASHKCEHPYLFPYSDFNVHVFVSLLLYTPIFVTCAGTKEIALLFATTVLYY